MAIGTVEKQNGPKGEALTLDIDYVASVDAVAQKAWITFRLPWTATTSLVVSGN